MPPRVGLFTRPYWRWVVAVWALALAAVGVRVLVLPSGHRSVFPIFRHAGASWLGQIDLYPEAQQGPGYPLFRYAPPVAAAFTPLALVPTKLGDLVWRAINAGALLGGLGWAIRRLPHPELSTGQSAAVFALVLPVALGGLSNGQCNGLVIGLILAGYAAAAECRFTISAAALAAATLLKLYPLAPALLLVALYPRRLGPRYLLALVIGFGLPFALAEPGYVARQYQLWGRYFLTEDRSGWPAEYANIDLQLVINRWIGPLSTSGYRAVEVFGGFMFLALVVAAARRLGSPDRAAPFALGLGCVWMTTLGPATESPTYLMLGPVASLAVVRAWAKRPVDPMGCALATIAYALLASLPLTLWSQPLSYAYRTLGPQPMAGLVLAVALIWDVRAGRPPARPTARPSRVTAGSAAACPAPGEPA